MREDLVVKRAEQQRRAKEIRAGEVEVQRQRVAAVVADGVVRARYREDDGTLWRFVGDVLERC